MTSKTLYVHPLNDAEEGPYSMDDALAAARRRLPIAQSEIDRARDDHRGGGTGPWHFVYGFQSVSIQIGPAARSVT